MEELEEGILPSSSPCNECRRRKAKCDKLIPECSICTRFRRHCLYEKNSKSPLTRKHLTDVESRLEHAEALLRKFRQQDARRESSNSSGDIEASSSTPSQSTATSFGVLLDPILDHIARDDGAVLMAHPEGLRPTVRPAEANPVTEDLDHPPAKSHEFSYDERYKSMTFSETRNYRQQIQDGLRLGSNNNEVHVLDGMGSLATHEQEDTGYLGIASGASFLRYLWIPPKGAGQPKRNPSRVGAGLPSIPSSIDSRRLIADSFIDAYFSLFHTSYPIIHEPNFRAAYSEIIPRPGGNSWKALAHIVAAIGAFSSMTQCLSVDTPFFFAAKASLSLDSLEIGNTTMVQAFALIANYLQKRNKPNSGYTYAGLAMRMAFGLGLHKEFSGWNISPLNLQMRRRLWWSLYVLEFGTSLTFSRPVALAGVEAAEIPFPLNLNDQDLTPRTRAMPEQRDEITVYSALRAQASFYISIREIYAQIARQPYPSPEILLLMDAQHIANWLDNLPVYYQEQSAKSIPGKYALSHAVVMWRYRNFRIVMYRPFVTRVAIDSCRQANERHVSDAERTAYQNAVCAAHETIYSISSFWKDHTQTRMAAWYSLYFIFQATLVPLNCLRKAPGSPSAASWRDDIRVALEVVEDMHFIHGSKCAAVLHELADPYMQIQPSSDSHDNIANRSLDMSSVAEMQGLEQHTQDSNLAFAGFYDGLYDLDSTSSQLSDPWQTLWPELSNSEADNALQDFSDHMNGVDSCGELTL